MKLILTGATGFIGSEVLTQALLRPSISSIIVLTRRPLPNVDNDNPKLRTFIVSDFTKLPDDALAACSDADACVWALGSAKIWESGAETKRTNLDFTIAGVRALMKARSKGMEKPLTFVYTSGYLTVRDPEKRPWFLGEMRTMRGDLETQLLALGEEHDDKLNMQIVRPGMVISKDSWRLKTMVWDLLTSIKTDVLALSMLDIAADGKGNRTWEHDELVDRGQKAGGLR